MKPFLLLLGLILAAAPASADQADVFYQEGMAAISRGEPEEARIAFHKALAARPNHPYAKFQLGQLKDQNGTLVARKRSTQLAAVLLPSVEFREVPLSDALSALNQMVETATEKKDGKAFTPNFMVQDPTGKLGEREITLTLKNVPAKTALDYLLQQAGGIPRYDEHAIVIRPAPNSGTTEKAAD